MSLSWPGQKNGQIPTDLMVDITGRGDYLHPTAAASFKAMNAAMKEDIGRTITAAPGSSAYRPEAEQIALFTQRYTKVSYGTGLWWNGSYWTKNPGADTAAIPDTSNHGWALAVDITGYETAAGGWQGSTYVNDGPVWKWLQANAARFGWSWTTGRASRESWHWEYVGSLTTTAFAAATPIEAEDQEDEMFVVINKESGVGALAAPGVFAGIPGELSDELQEAMKVLKLSAAAFNFMSSACLAAGRSPVRVYANTKTQQWVVGGAEIWYPIPSGDGTIWTNIFGPYIAVDDTTFLKLRKGFTGQ